MAARPGPRATGAARRRDDTVIGDAWFLGAHCESTDPLAEAALRGADVVQINLASAQLKATRRRKEAAALVAQAAGPCEVSASAHARRT